MKIPIRVQRVNTGLLIVGAALVLVAFFGGKLSVAEVSVKELSRNATIAIYAIGGIVVAASFFVGVDVGEEPTNPGSPRDLRDQLCAAASRLEAALRDPDVMGVNVSNAKALVADVAPRAARARKLKRPARALLAASTAADADAAAAVLTELIAKA